MLVEEAAPLSIIPAKIVNAQDVIASANAITTVDERSFDPSVDIANELNGVDGSNTSKANGIDAIDTSKPSPPV